MSYASGKPTWKERIFMQYVIHKTYFAKGVGEITYLKNIWEMVLLMSIWLSTQGYNIPFKVIIGGTLFLIFLMWLLGYIWDKNQFYHIEAEFGLRRNYLSIEHRKFMKRVSEKIEKLGGK